VFLNGNNDKIICAQTSNDNYLLKDSYFLIKQVQEQHTIHKWYIFYWFDMVPPKVGCFQWLTIIYEALTSDCLARINIGNNF